MKQSPEQKRPYHKPELKMYGEVAELTEVIPAYSTLEAYGKTNEMTG